MRANPIDRPADLDLVRESYDRVADNYVEMVTSTGIGDIRRHPWLKAAIDAFADTVGTRGPVLDVGCGPGTVTGYLAERGLDVSGVDLSPGMIDAFADTVGTRGPVLDVGCGPGTVTGYLAERGLDVSGVDLSPGMIAHARRLYPHCRFDVASATELELEAESLGGVLGWWSLFNLPRAVLPQVLASFTRALKPGGQFITATHVGDSDVERTEAYGGVPVRWTTHCWQPGQLVELIERAGLRPVAELRLPADAQVGPGVVIMAERRA